MNKKILIIITVIFVLLSFNVVAESIDAIRINYIYNQTPDSYMIGNNFCFDQAENRVCAPVILFDTSRTDENQLSFHIELETARNFHGRACITNAVEDTWNRVFSEITNVCTNFNTNNNIIEFNLRYSLKNKNNLKIVLIPESNVEDTRIVNAELNIKEDVIIEEPETIIPAEPEELARCNLINIYFDEKNSSTKMSNKINIISENCVQSFLELSIYRKTRTGTSLVSEKQMLITGNEFEIFWSADDSGEYFAKAESLNVIESETIKINEFQQEALFEDREFYEVMALVRESARINQKNAEEICKEMDAQLLRDVCFEDLAVFTRNKRLCNNIKSSNRKESCYTFFAIEGDPLSCIHSSDKMSCLMLSLIPNEEGFSFNPYDEIDSKVTMQNKEEQNLVLLFVLLIITSIILFLLVEFFFKKSF